MGVSGPLAGPDRQIDALPELLQRHAAVPLGAALLKSGQEPVAGRLRFGLSELRPAPGLRLVPALFLALGVEEVFAVLDLPELLSFARGVHGWALVFLARHSASDLP